jgi:hypothetical protein
MDQPVILHDLCYRVYEEAIHYIEFFETYNNQGDA